MYRKRDVVTDLESPEGGIKIPGIVREHTDISGSIWRHVHSRIHFLQLLIPLWLKIDSIRT